MRSGLALGQARHWQQLYMYITKELPNAANDLLPIIIHVHVSNTTCVAGTLCIAHCYSMARMDMHNSRIAFSAL